MVRHTTCSTYYDVLTILLQNTMIIDHRPRARELDPECQADTSGEAAAVAPLAQWPEGLLMLAREIANGGQRKAIVQERAARQGALRGTGRRRTGG